MELIEIFRSGLSYWEYRELVDNSVASGRTTGNNQSEKLLEFTKLNIQRMNRIDKTVRIDSDTAEIFKSNSSGMSWILIGDAWCGDCAQIIPLINKIAESSCGKFDLRIISRDAYPQLIEKYHSGGAKAIPKLLILCNETGELLCTWGPRPKPAQEIMLRWKTQRDIMSWEDFEKELHLWYAKDKGQTIINEFVKLIQECGRDLIFPPINSI